MKKQEEARKAGREVPNPTTNLRIKRTTMIELLTSLWLFNTTQPAQSTLTAEAPQAQFTYRADLSVKKLHFRLENAELRNVQISALEN